MLDKIKSIKLRQKPSGESSNDYLFQEFCVLYTRDFIEYENGELKVSKFGHIIGLFMYTGKLAGLYTRIGKDSIISGLHSYYTVPNLLVEYAEK